MPVRTGPSRRDVAAAALTGIGALSAAPSWASETPRSPSGNISLVTLARLHGRLDDRPSYVWFDGTMIATGPDGAGHPIGTARGVFVRRLRRLPSTAGWTIDEIELLETVPDGASRSGGGRNPITGSAMTQPDVRIVRSAWRLDDASHTDFATFDHGGQLLVSRSTTPGRRDVPAAIMSQTIDLVCARNAMVARGPDMIEALGTMRRAERWPAWLAMGDLPGHLETRCSFMSGPETIDAMPDFARVLMGRLAKTAI